MKTAYRFLVASTLAAAAMVAAAPASAVTYVDTGVQTGNNGGGPTLATYQYLAGRFTLAAAATLTDIQGYIATYYTDTIRVTLHANAANLPGASLYSATFAALANGSNGTWQGVSAQNWALAAGTYWVSFDNLTSANAFMPSSAATPLAAYATSGTQGANWGASGSNFGLRVSGNVGAVPEPASWAMMIVGVGAIGASARRRRSVAQGAALAA